MLEKITVMGIEYTVEYVEVVNKEEPRFGQVDFFESRIQIDRSLSEDMKKQTLLHEILHCICQGLGLYDIGENENAIQSMATALYDVSKSNKAIFS